MSGASRTTKSHACSYSCRSAEFISHIAICEGEKTSVFVAGFVARHGIWYNIGIYVYKRGGESALLLRFRRLGQTGIMSEKENQIVVYRPNETVRLDVCLENGTARGECCQCDNVAWCVMGARKGGANV